MKKALLIIFLSTLTYSCGSVSITRTTGQISKDEIKKRLGDYSIIVTDVSESYLNYIKAIDKQSQMGDNNTSEKLQSLMYAANQYYLFEIRHIDVYPVEKWNFSITITDARGNSQVDDIIYFEKLFSDTVVGEAWMIKTKKPVKRESYLKDELPFSLKIQLLGQKLEYKIKPK